MQEEMKCPNCGGDKFKFMGGNTFKCAYCGTTFANEQQAPAVEKEVVYVQATPPPSQPQYQQTVPQQSYAQSKGKSKGVAAVLCFFLGAIGGHKFYLGKVGIGLLYLVFCWTWIPCIISVIDFIVLLCMDEREFDRKYNY
ncbi:MAG: NINE protein [Bacteroidaceae bacterium]|nr:NINE protein [Bacteroidaceae bacterium]